MRQTTKEIPHFIVLRKMDEKTPAGETPLQIAIGRGYKEIVELLRKNRAKEDNSG